MRDEGVEVLPLNRIFANAFSTSSYSPPLPMSWISKPFASLVPSVPLAALRPASQGPWCLPPHAARSQAHVHVPREPVAASHSARHCREGATWSWLELLLTPGSVLLLGEVHFTLLLN